VHGPSRTLFATIGANVRRARERKGLTQAALAERAEIALKYVQRVEYGSAGPSLDVLQRIAGALGTDVWRLCKPTRRPNPTRARGRPKKKKRAGSMITRLR